MELLAWAGESLLYQAHLGQGVVNGLASASHDAGGLLQVTVSPRLAIGVDARKIDPDPNDGVSKARISR
jgi:hypothetical protein